MPPLRPPPRSRPRPRILDRTAQGIFPFFPFNLFSFCTLFSLAFLFSSCSSKETNAILQPSESLAPILAEETVNAAGPNRKVAIISPDSKWGPISPVEQTFRSAIKKQGFAIIDAKSASLGDPMHSGEVGLKSSDFIEVLEKFPDVGAIVSFAGPPLLNSQDFSKVAAAHPPVLVVATAMLGTTPGVPGDRNQFPRLLDSKAVQLIIMDGSDPTPSPSTKRDPTHDLFSQNFRILRAN
jgi:hypothetical protein